MALPKKQQCDNHQWWEYSTDSGALYARCQRCGLVSQLKKSDKEEEEDRKRNKKKRDSAVSIYFPK